MISVTSIFITSFFSQRQLGNFFSKILVYKYLVSLLCSCSLLNNIKDSIFFSINNHLTAFFDIRFTSKMGLVSNKLSCGGLIACFTHQNYLDTIFFYLEPSRIRLKYPHCLQRGTKSHLKKHRLF